MGARCRAVVRCGGVTSLLIAFASGILVTLTSAPATAAPAPTALAVLDTLSVKGRAAMTGYSRDLFGGDWTDVDGNGCDTRSDILRRDLVERVMSSRCSVMSGVLYPDPFTGRPLTYVRGRSVVDIDHVVALGNAWATGAQGIGATARIQLANDPLNLLAVSASANRQKQDGDAATWLPSNKAFRCAYVARRKRFSACCRPAHVSGSRPMGRSRILRPRCRPADPPVPSASSAIRTAQPHVPLASHPSASQRIRPSMPPTGTWIETGTASPASDGRSTERHDPSGASSESRSCGWLENV